MTSLWKGVCFQMIGRRKSRCGENFRPVTSKPQLVHGSEVDSATIQQTLYFSGGGNFRCILFQRHVWSVCLHSPHNSKQCNELLRCPLLYGQHSVLNQKRKTMNRQTNENYEHSFSANCSFLLSFSIENCPWPVIRTEAKTKYGQLDSQCKFQVHSCLASC